MECKKILEKNKEEYEKIAEEFSQSRFYPRLRLFFFKRYLKNGLKVLDAGCGNGCFYPMLKDFSLDYIGLDSSQALIRLARKKWGNFFMLGDVLCLPFEKESFDLVFSLAAFQHLPGRNYQNQALKEMFRVIKPGGRMIITNWNLWQITLKKKSLWKYFFNTEGIKQYDLKERLPFQDVITKWQGNHTIGYLYYHAFTLRELKRLVKGVGFQIEESYYLKEERKTRWWRGYNLVVVAKKD